MSDAYARLRNVTTATITTMLLKKGIRKCWLSGTKPLGKPGARLIGPAFTMRFVPAREDLATPASWAIRSRRGPPSRRCRKAASRSSTRRASTAPASSATSW